MSYRKRARKGWRASKSYKETSNRKERQYEKDEIREELKIHEDPDFRYNVRNKRVFPDAKSKQIHDLKKKLHRAEKWLRIFQTYGASFFGRSVDSQKHEIRKLKEKLKELE